MLPLIGMLGHTFLFVNEQFLARQDFSKYT